jgi:hypothetical protein
MARRFAVGQSHTMHGQFHYMFVRVFTCISSLPMLLHDPQVQECCRNLRLKNYPGGLHLRT